MTSENRSWGQELGLYRVLFFFMAVSALIQSGVIDIVLDNSETSLETMGVTDDRT